MQTDVAGAQALSATAAAMRRSSRISVAILVCLRSMDGTVEYAEECQTLVVNAHGCGLRSPKPLPVGTRVEVETLTGHRRGIGRVLNCGALSANSWLIGVQLEVPGNLWDLHPVPADWPGEPSSKEDAAPAVQSGRLAFSPFASPHPPEDSSAAITAAAPSAAAAQALQASLEEQARQLSAGLAREAERAMAALRQHADDCTRRNAEEVTSVLVESRADISRHAEVLSRDAAANLRQRMRAELQDQLRQLREAGEALHGETEQVERERRTLAMELAELRNKREQFEAMVQQLPETIETQVNARVEAMLEQIRTRAQGETATLIGHQLEAARARLRDTAADVHAKWELDLGASLEARNQAMQASYDSARRQLEQLQASGESLLSTVQKELRAHAQDAVRDAVQETLELTQEQFNKSAAAHQTQVTQVEAEMSQLLAGVVGRGEQAARQLQELMTALEQQRQTADQAMMETAKRAQEEIVQSAAAGRQAQVAQLQAELDRAISGAVGRGEQAARQLQQLVEGLRQESQAGETQSAALRQQVEQAQAWLAEETLKFKERVHDAFVEAGGEIKGRMHSAIEAADAPIQRRAQQLQSQIEQAAAAKQGELLQHVERARELLAEARAEAQKSADELLQQRLAQTLQAFQQDADKLARASLERWQSALQESCKVIPEMLQRALNSEK